MIAVDYKLRGTEIKLRKSQCKFMCKCDSSYIAHLLGCMLMLLGAAPGSLEIEIARAF